MHELSTEIQLITFLPKPLELIMLLADQTAYMGILSLYPDHLPHPFNRFPEPSQQRQREALHLALQLRSQLPYLYVA
jgi:hypothetical protein